MTNANDALVSIVKLCIKNNIQLGIDFDGTVSVATNNVVLTPVDPNKLSKVVTAIITLSDISISIKDAILEPEFTAIKG